jgi:hypothetical protein
MTNSNFPDRDKALLTVLWDRLRNSETSKEMEDLIEEIEMTIDLVKENELVDLKNEESAVDSESRGYQEAGDEAVSIATGRSNF